MLLLWCRVRGISLSGAQEPAGAARAGLLAGLLFATEFAALFLAFKYTTASRATIFLYCSPFWVALVLPHFVKSERLNRVQWLGLVCAFFGVLLALSDGWRTDDAAHASAWWGDGLALLAGLGWGLTTCVLRASPLQHVRFETAPVAEVGMTTLITPVVVRCAGGAGVTDFNATTPDQLLIQNCPAISAF